jgi:ectoine hydroxylase-related dioxygenase (phytanoyl-CoA dioxygenase family)
MNGTGDSMIEAAMSGIEEALRECGVTETTLQPGEKDALDRHGYLVMPDVVDADGLHRLRAAFERATDQGQRAGNVQQSGTRHVDNLANKDVAFDSVYTHPKVLAAVYHVLRCSFRVFQLSGRDPLPGYGQQGLHTDWLPRAPSELFSIVTALWLLDDFTPNNGATRLIPGSHLVPRPLPKSMMAPASRHPDQRLIIAKAGSVLVFNGHLWHSGTRNETNGPRRALQCQFLRRDLIRFANTTPEVPERLAPAAQYILGV